MTWKWILALVIGGALTGCSATGGQPSAAREDRPQAPARILPPGQRLELPPYIPAPADIDRA